MTRIRAKTMKTIYTNVINMQIPIIKGLRRDLQIKNNLPFIHKISLKNVDYLIH